MMRFNYPNIPCSKICVAAPMDYFQWRFSFHSCLKENMPMLICSLESVRQRSGDVALSNLYHCVV